MTNHEPARGWTLRALNDKGLLKKALDAQFEADYNRPELASETRGRTVLTEDVGQKVLAEARQFADG